eukprot:365744-Chlamydomonas_euryale.AAC.22
MTDPWRRDWGGMEGEPVAWGEEGGSTASPGATQFVWGTGRSMGGWVKNRSKPTEQQTLPRPCAAHQSAVRIGCQVCQMQHVLTSPAQAVIAARWFEPFFEKCPSKRMALWTL